MQKSSSFFIATRYILAKKDNRLVSVTSLISMAGLTLGVLSLIIVLSVFNGSQGIMRDRTLITVPHGDIFSDAPIPNWQAVRTALENHEEINSVSPFTRGEAMLSDKGYHQVSEVKGIIPEAEIQVSTIEESMISGSLDDLVAGQHGIVIGLGLATNLRLGQGDSLNLIVPEPASANFNLQMHRFTVVGIFDVQFDIGANLALIHIQDSREVFALDSIGQALRLRLSVTDIDQAGRIVADAISRLEQQFPGQSFQGLDWSIREASLFNALKMEKILIRFLLFMIVVIGAFNIVSTLVMVVNDKQADIAILRTMGAGKHTIMSIFMVQGLIVGVLGTFLGAALGILVTVNFASVSALIENLLAPGNIYLISRLPAELQTSDVILVCLVAPLISFLATLYPAWRASRIHPAEVLRYE